MIFERHSNLKYKYGKFSVSLQSIRCVWAVKRVRVYVNMMPLVLRMMAQVKSLIQLIVISASDVQNVLDILMQDVTCEKY